MGKHLSALRFAQRRGHRFAYRTAGYLKGSPVASLHALASQSAGWNDVAIRFLTEAALPPKAWTDAAGHRQTIEGLAAT